MNNYYFVGGPYNAQQRPVADDVDELTAVVDIETSEQKYGDITVLPRKILAHHHYYRYLVMGTGDGVSHYIYVSQDIVAGFRSWRYNQTKNPNTIPIYEPDLARITANPEA